jgi:CRISPR-associated protein Cas5d
MAQDRNENKHFFIAKRMIERGGRRDIFLGTRECQGYVEPCRFGQDSGFYDNYGELSFDLMFHGFDYPDEIGKNEFFARFWRPKMINGVMILSAQRNAVSGNLSVL